MKNPLSSLATRITLLVFTATVVSSLTVSWIATQSLEAFLREKIDQRFPQVAVRLVGDLDQWYALRAKEIEIFAASAILSESLPALDQRGPRGNRARAEARQYLRYVLDSFPQFASLALAAPDGTLLLEVGDPAKPSAEALEVLSRSTDVTRISDAQVVEDRLLQIASAPMRDANARLTGYLLAAIPLSNIDPLLYSAEFGVSASIFLVDGDHRFLSGVGDFTSDARYRGDSATRETGSPVAYYDDARGERVIGTSHLMPRFGWTLVIEQPYDEAFAPIVGSMSRVAGLNTLIIFLVGLAAFRIAGSIVEPIRDLSDAARRLSVGERGVQIDESGSYSDEVRLLTRAFNEMSRGLGRNARELEENQLEIESTNQALMAKNEELSNVNLVLEQLSITDGLTKLHNHRYFQDALTNECKRATRTKDPLCLIVIDIDFFKKWNDRLGHAGGDEILRRAAEVLNQSCRETDLLARYGGEEFAILAIGTDLDGATALAEKIRQTVEETEFLTDVPSERESLTVSIGVASYAGSRYRLFEDADAALYEAKDTGRNRVVVAAPSSDRSAFEPSEPGETDGHA